jgi:hypothetical protein
VPWCLNKDTINFETWMHGDLLLFYRTPMEAAGTVTGGFHPKSEIKWHPTVLLFAPTLSVGYGTSFFSP